MGLFPKITCLSGVDHGSPCMSLSGVWRRFLIAMWRWVAAEGCGRRWGGRRSRLGRGRRGVGAVGPARLGAALAPSQPPELAVEALEPHRGRRGRATARAPAPSPRAYAPSRARCLRWSWSRSSHTSSSRGSADPPGRARAGRRRERRRRGRARRGDGGGTHAGERAAHGPVCAVGRWIRRRISRGALASIAVLGRLCAPDADGARGRPLRATRERRRRRGRRASARAR